MDLNKIYNKTINKVFTKLIENSQTDKQLNSAVLTSNQIFFIFPIFDTADLH